MAIKHRVKAKKQSKRNIVALEKIEIELEKPKPRMIYFTGDTHGLVGLLERVNSLPKDRNEEDYLIIAGDFGVIWKEETLENNLKELEKIPITILFVDGNHENFDLLNKFPVEEWNGGKVHRITKNCLHLMRGQVFEIEGKKFFTFGGAQSRDKERRIEGVSWWAEEIPSEEEFLEAQRNLQRVNGEVDYVITHAPFACVMRRLFAKSFDYYAYGNESYHWKNNEVSYMLEEKLKDLKAKIFFSGHQHLDEEMQIFDEKYVLLYKNIFRILS